jgi:superfamily II DNA or RNA helicase
VHAPLPVPGDHVWIRQRRWRVERTRRDRGVVALDVASRGRRLTFLAPFDRPARIVQSERPCRARQGRALGRLAHLVARRYGIRTLAAAVDAHLTLFPYQLEPALAVVTGARRVLVADEVGLGKTIQAGLVIAEILRRRFAARILVVVPAGLADQWAGELDRRFRITCRLADRAGLDAMVRAGARGDNPWQRPGVWLVSFDYLKQPQVIDALPLCPWALVVVDEAHTACGDSARHAVCHDVARRARHVVLLTATPHDGDETRFARLLEMGVLAGLPDRLTVFRRTRAHLAASFPRAVRWHSVRCSDAERTVFGALDAYERTVLRAAGAERRDAAVLLLSVFRKRALSTLHALAVSLERRLAWLDGPGRVPVPDWLQPSLGFDPDADETDETDPGSLALDVGLDPRRERNWVGRLYGLAVAAAGTSDSKVSRLAALAERVREPLVVFTEFRDSLDVLAGRLQSVRPLAVLHGGQTPDERRRELDRFLSGPASLLVATDVASQGLNLQSRARWVVNLELPWNPARLEQRAGRVDRIGQTRPVHVTTFVAGHPAEARIAGRLVRRTLTARRSLGADDVLGRAIPDTTRWRAHVLTGQPIDVAPPRHLVRACRRWVRAGRVAARDLERRRRLAAHWRPASLAATRPWRTRSYRPARLGTLAGAGLLVFAVPLLDNTGGVLEQHVVGVRLPRGRPALNDPTIEAGRHVAARSLAPRVRRVIRLLAGLAPVEAARERALAGVLMATCYPGEVQPGLFDRHDVRAFEMARRMSLDIGRDADARSEPSAPIVTVGRPVLALILDGRA